MGTKLHSVAYQKTAVLICELFFSPWLVTVVTAVTYKPTVFQRLDLPQSSGGMGTDKNVLRWVHYNDLVSVTVVYRLGLAVPRGCMGVGSCLLPFHLKMESDPASAVLCFFLA
jgi:hypothetical protein